MKRWRFRLWRRGIFLEDVGGTGKYAFATEDRYMYESKEKRHFYRYGLFLLLIVGLIAWFVWESIEGWGIFCG